MRILVGQVFKHLSDPITAIEIPGLGVIEAKISDDDVGFQYIDLTKSQSLKLINLLSAEFTDGKENNL